VIRDCVAWITDNYATPNPVSAMAAVPVDVVSGTGIAGLTLGGDAENPDLFWGLRGGAASE
jgi:hypothetical protein